MIPHPDYHPPFPRNRTFFVILLIHETGKNEVFHILFHTETEAIDAARQLTEDTDVTSYRIFPVTSPRPSARLRGENFWY